MLGRIVTAVADDLPNQLPVFLLDMSVVVFAIRAAAREKQLFLLGEACQVDAIGRAARYLIGLWRFPG